MAYSRKIIGKNRNLKKSRKGGNILKLLNRARLKLLNRARKKSKSLSQPHYGRPAARSRSADRPVVSTASVPATAKASAVVTAASHPPAAAQYKGSV